MRGHIALLLVYLSITNGNLVGAGKSWQWKSCLPVLSPDDFKHSGHIVGGTDKMQHSWPDLVALFIDGMYFCMGSLISNEWVLTAAHCMDGSTSVDVVMGFYNVDGNDDTQVTMRSDVYIIHEQWNVFTLANDIAVIKLPEPVNFNENINSIGLPSVDVSVGDISIVTGENSHGVLEMNVTVISNIECAAVFGPMINEKILCAEIIRSEGYCNYFPGTLNKDGKIYGISSFVSSCGCDSGYPLGFTRVIQFLDWVESTTGITPQ